MIHVVGASLFSRTQAALTEPALPDAEVEGNTISTLIDGSGACSSTLCPRYPQTSRNTGTWRSILWQANPPWSRPREITEPR